MRPRFWEFFAGGGMVRAALEPEWTCAFANDIDPRKAAAYRENWGGDELRVGDVARLAPSDLPAERPELVWASFPCQDLSLAGPGGGLDGRRSGTFRPFWRIVQGLVEARGARPVVVLENVCGALTSHGGADFQTIVGAFRSLGYRVGALVIDAALFVPQSRPRLFFVGAPEGAVLPRSTQSDAPDPLWAPASLLRAHVALPAQLNASWMWWRLPAPRPRRHALADLLETDPADAPWRSEADTARLVALAGPLHRARIEQYARSGGPAVGAVCRRMRPAPDGRTVQRAEARFDGLAGCLRTPAGGSSRQTLLEIDQGRVRSRLISPRETARLMGLPDTYRLPRRCNDAYRLTGDGVVVPAARHLSLHLLLPLASAGSPTRTRADAVARAVA